MPKKSHRVASRQAKVSKERKRKKRAQSTRRQAPVIPATPTPAIEPPAISTPEIEPVATPKPSTAKPPLAQTVPRYQYFIADLRRTAVLAGAILIILIALAFVLG
ncbi:MAG: hypothetical protein DRI26_06420 [Chloroflexi bacterium]|nr:MAG: hypothetical protein DRI26_06420 [Chloroflexota bacterium]